MARRDEDGFYFIVDRKKDLIIRGGFNVYPREIEEVLYEHPAVLEAAVVGMPHPTHGEEVGAAVALRPGADATPDELREYVKARVAAYKYPRHVWLVDALPKGADRQGAQARDRGPRRGRARWRVTAGPATAVERPSQPAQAPRAPLDLLLDRRRARRRPPVLRPARRRCSSSARWPGSRGPTGRPRGGAGGRARPDRRAAPRRSPRRKRDRRFADPAWTQNPLLRRIVQAYLAAGRTAEELVGDAELDWRDTRADRASCVDNLRRGAAPSNNPLLSARWRGRRPSTRAGASVLHGAAQPGRATWPAAPRVPTMVAPDAFEVGVDLARDARRTSCCAPRCSS